MQRISIQQLTLGMYVEQIETEHSRTRMAKPGYVRRPETIQKLRQNGIKYVWIDADQLLSAEEIHYKGPLNKGKYASTGADIDQARTLIDTSKQQLSRLLNDIYDNKPIDVSPIEDLAGGIVDNIFKRQHAVAWISGIRDKSAYLMEHSLNVAFLLVNFGRYLGFDHATLQELAVGGLVHDIGKVLVADEILNKPGKLTAEEFDHMKLHQVFSQPVLDSIPDLSQIARDVSLMHHEKLDGNGYPNGLQGEALHTIGRMSGIVDIYDALTADRCYKRAMSPSEAFKIMMGLTPFHLDPTLLRSFIQCIGFYPIGSLVELEDGRVGLVWQENLDDITRPVVKIFYSVRSNQFREVEYIDLNRRHDIRIARATSEMALDIHVDAFR
ncbi:HD-GYP domain-containing protein [Salinivibrio sp. ES.052]|uniref:HD-GYP domain-containing protein n=1 Tax=Salinivibrio sp. ES.052 TaxID=1882823 RepID=UPI00092A20D0|nr:HD-GYP domain-containing protein [Salinivibrio sp. ES.052]SIO32820.1 metal dependent phosphohydrolase [Salinivibrio sp. ES.052]